MRRASPALVALTAVAVLASGCGSDDHGWKGEFTAQLEVATNAIEGAKGDLHPHRDYGAFMQTSEKLASSLRAQNGSIRKLDPPGGCGPVQEEGAREVEQIGRLFHELPKNLDPYLQHRLPQILKEAVAKYGRLEHEAETCA